MAQSASLPPSRPPAALLLLLAPAAPSGGGPERGAIAPLDEPETPIEVEFVGLTPEQQQRALSGWPGAQRFTLARRPAAAG